MIDFTGKAVIVTGGSRGLGRAIALGFAECGADVVVSSRKAEACAAVVAEIEALGRRAVAIPCHTGQWDGLGGLIDGALAAFGRLDVLVNNAGIAGPTAKVDEMHPEDWDRCLAICLTGQFNCARLAVPLLRQSRNASIVNISSAAGRLGFAMRSPYAAAKWGVIGFTKSLSIELGPDNIRVNAILPGLVAGDRQRRVLEAKAQQRGLSYAEMEKIAFSYTSIKDYVTPQQLADQIVFMCSPRGKTISGQAISICGDTQMLG